MSRPEAQREIDPEKAARFAARRAELAFRNSEEGFKKHVKALPGFPADKVNEAWDIFSLSSKIIATVHANDFHSFKLRWASQHGIDYPANAVLWHYASGSSVDPTQPSWHGFDFTQADFPGALTVSGMLRDYLSERPAVRALLEQQGVSV